MEEKFKEKKLGEMQTKKLNETRIEKESDDKGLFKAISRMFTKKLPAHEYEQKKVLMPQIGQIAPEDSML